MTRTGSTACSLSANAGAPKRLPAFGRLGSIHQQKSDRHELFPAPRNLCVV
jgi:hypothetical protein